MNIGELARFRAGIATDTISEQTAASGVTIDSVLCKDGSVTGAASGTFTTTYVKAADTQGLALVNSSGTSVVTVSDAGAVTAGPSGGSRHAIRGATEIRRPDITSGADADGIVFYDANDLCGYIAINATANTVTYNTSSDARLKTNHRDFCGIGVIKQLKPTKYERVCSPGVDEYGFVAQELVDVIREAVSIGSEDVNEKPWGVDYGRITPVLVKAIQELSAQVNELQAKVAALESK